MYKKILSVIMITIFALALYADAENPEKGELVITEVNSTVDHESSYIEIYNNTYFDLSLNNVVLEYYNNGSSDPRPSINFSGSISSGEYIIVTKKRSSFESAYPGITADYSHGFVYLNGDNDALKLVSDGVVIDYFNDAGNNPSDWADETLWERTDFLAEGKSLTDDWRNCGQNKNGTPKAKNISDNPDDVADFAPGTTENFGLNEDTLPVISLTNNGSVSIMNLSVKINRGQEAPESGDKQSIKRWIEAEADNHPAVPLLMRFYYKQSEVNGLDEDKFNIFSYWDETWHEYPVTQRDTVDNWVETQGLGYSGIWTLKEGKDSSLPVEFSTFSLAQSENDVFVRWTTQTESDLRGFYVLKSETGNLEDANNISSLILATNSVSAEEYFYEDKFVTPGQTYWYWIEAATFNETSSFTASQSIVIEKENDPAEEVPGFEQETGIENVYPNPFNPPVNISFFIDEKTVEENAEIGLEIYNVKGQSVHKRNLGVKSNSGIYTISWNGNDKEGKECGSGIYFVKLTAGSHQSFKKSIKLK